MNKIYKVIWSKVKNQYVVVSELAHSNGKQSRTSRNSIRSRIAALVVCGAIAAFGVFSALPTQQVFAAAYATSAGQYIAVKVPENTSDYKDMVAYDSNGEYVLTGATGCNAPLYVKQTLTYIDIENGNKEVTAEFFVRKGYTLVAEYGERHDNSANNLQISAYKNADAPSNADNGLLTSTQVIGTASEYKTLVGQSLIDTSVGKFGGTVNSPSTGVTSGSAFYTAHSQLSYSDNFKAVNWDEKTKSYKYDTGSSQITVPKENVYVITNSNKTTAGVFVVDGQIYTGTVFGRNNEILTTATDDNGNYYSMWSAEIKDPDTPINLTKSQFEQAMKYQQDSIKTAAGNDIEKVVSNAAKDGNGGSIDLLRQGEYNVETGQYSTEKPSVNGTLSITNTGGTNGSGDDLKIQFQADGSDPFTVDAGSKVEAVQTDGSDKISAIKINGEEYKFGGGSSVIGGYVDSDGNVYINQEGDTPGQGGKLIGKITVSGTNGLKVTANRIDGNKGINYEVSNNLTVNGEVSEQHKNGGNWTITDSQGETPLTLTNTTLVAGKATKTPIENNEYGNTYTVTDTDGNEVTLNDVASASKLSNVAKEAGKHTSVSVGDNLGINETPNGNGGTNYKVTLDDTLYLGGNHTEGDSKITLDGATGTAIIGNSTSGKATIGGVNITTTTTGESTSSTIGGLTNKAWNGTNYVSGQAATEDQLQQAISTVNGNIKTYSAGDGITIATDDITKNNKISVNAGKGLAFETEAGKEGQLKVNVGDGLSIAEGKVVNNFKVEADKNATRDNKNGGNWTITDTSKPEGQQIFTNTTLSSSVGKQPITGENVAGSGYGNTYTISDTDGNTATLEDVASATKLSEVDSKVDGNTTNINKNTSSIEILQEADKLNVKYTNENKDKVVLGGTEYNNKNGGTRLTNVAYATGDDGSEAVNVDYLNDAISDAVEKGGVVSETEKHLATNSGTKPDGNATYAPDADGNITISEVNGDGTATGNSVVISDVASKEQVDKNTSHIGDMNFEGTKHIGDGTDNLTDAIKDLDSAISDMQTGVGAQVEANTVSGGRVDKDGNVILETNKDKNIQTKIKLTDSEVVGGKAENGKLTINKKDNYTGAETSIDIEGVATTDMIGAKDKEDLASKYKDADKDGNATTEYITESESMVEADVALDHAIQDVANTSYANDMVLSNRIDSVEKRLGNVEERIDKVGAMAAAIANLRTMGFDPEAPTEIAIGVGQYKSETGLALGIFHYPNQDFMLSASLSSSGDELMGGIGATWKLGRKSAAERAKDEEARHLEQAEEMKKLAQQEKVKAQAQRHAKLLAERQQASQKNA